MNEKGFNVILEGCDGVGKSSIFEELMHRGLFGERMMGIRHPMPPKNYEVGKKLNEELLRESNKFSGLVFDRHILSERVYAPIMRDYYPLYIGDLEKKLKPHNILFLITADLEIVEKRFDGKGITLELIPRILEDYKYYFDGCYYPKKFIIDTSNITPYQALQKVEEYLTMDERENTLKTFSEIKFMEDMLNNNPKKEDKKVILKKLFQQKNNKQ